MKKPEQTSTRTRDDALLEALREAYRPDELPELRRARIRARVRARVADPSSDRDTAPRSGSGLVPAAAALAGVLAAILGLLTLSPTRREGPSDTPTPEDLSAAALLLDDGLLLADGPMGAGDALPPDYQAIAELLERRT